MRKLIICAASVAVLIGGVMASAPDKITANKAREKRILAEYGGLVMPPDNGKHVLIVNACEVNQQSIDRFKWCVDKFLHIPLKFESITNVTTCVFKSTMAMKGEKTPAIIYVYAGESDGPVLNVYVEEAIACINITPFKSVSPEIEGDRLLKELLRGFGLILGGYYSAQVPSVLAPAYSIGQLDSIGVKMYSPMHLAAIMNGARMLKLPNLTPIPYRSACIQGWAPAPTNDAQKAIWDKVHAIPKNPMKIEFDKKAGR